MKPKTAVLAALPPGILASDLKYPTKERLDYAIGDHGHLQFYHTTAFGWCLTTLRIGGAGRQATERYYAVRVEDGSTVRIGKGPHVTQAITVYVRQSRTAALKRYADLYQSGGARAGEIRDRISSRRAQGVLERASGRRSWRWDV